MAKIHILGKTKLTLFDGAGNVLVLEPIGVYLEVHWYMGFIFGMGQG